MWETNFSPFVAIGDYSLSFLNGHTYRGPCNCHPLNSKQNYLHKIKMILFYWFPWVGHLPGGREFADDTEAWPMSYSSYFFSSVFINKCKQIKSCLGDLCHMFSLRQRERPDCFCPIFSFSWLPALQFGFTPWSLSWKLCIWVEVSWHLLQISSSFSVCIVKVF